MHKYTEIQPGELDVCLFRTSEADTVHLLLKQVLSSDVCHV